LFSKSIDLSTSLARDVASHGRNGERPHAARLASKSRRRCLRPHLNLAARIAGHGQPEKTLVDEDMTGRLDDVGIDGRTPARHT
jgi:hypothetical protein